jgi:hypothetical protein
MKDTRTWLLVLLSFCIVGTWIYHLYDKSQYGQHPKIVYEVVAPSSGQTVKDSFPEPDSIVSGKDTANLGIAARLEDIVSLRNEIATMLMDSNITTKDLYKTEGKIRILQQKITTLHEQTDSLLNEKKKSDVENEKKDEPVKEKRIRNEKEAPAILPTPPAPKKESQQDPQEKVNTDKNDPLPVTDTDATFKASQVSFKAINLYDAGKTQPTMQAKTTTYLAISFLLKNNTTSFSNTPIYLVLTDPQGNIIQDDLWEAGIINTQNEGNIRYTRKINVEYTRAEPKEIDLSIQLPKFPEGRYKIQLYHNGLRIGKADLGLD